MNRRSLLASVGAPTVSCLSGCADVEGILMAGGDCPDGTIEESPRCDNPPYEIEKPKENGEWNAHFLGRNMNGKPSLEFERAPQVDFKDIPLNNSPYYIEVIQNQDALESILAIGNGTEDEITYYNQFNFEEHVLILVICGRSLSTEWKRIEKIDCGYHLYGYWEWPRHIQPDLYLKYDIIKVERITDPLEFARTSVTIDKERRVHFNSTEDIITIPEEDSC